MGLKFGREIANRIRRRAPQRGDKWHLDEVVAIAGKKHWLWRAIDQDGFVLDFMPINLTVPAVRLVADVVTRLQPITACELATVDRARSSTIGGQPRASSPGEDHVHRFWRNPVAFLVRLEQSLIQPTLPV